MIKAIFLLALIASSAYASNCEADVVTAFGHVMTIYNDLKSSQWGKAVSDALNLPADISHSLNDCEACLADLKSIEGACGQVWEDCKAMDFAAIISDGKTCISAAKEIYDKCATGKVMSWLVE